LAALAGVRDTDDSVQVRRAAAGVLATERDTKVPMPVDREDVMPQPRAEAVAPAEPARVTPDPVPPKPKPMPPDPVPPKPKPMPPKPMPPEPTPPETPEAAKPKPGPMPWDPEPSQPEPRKPQPVRETPAATERKPAGSAALYVAAGLLVPVSVLLYAVGTYGLADVSLSEDWYHNLIWLVQFVAAVLVLATRRARWAGLLFGVLAWSWADLAPVLHSSAQSYFEDAWGFLVIADLIAIAAQTCLGIALLRERAAGGRIATVRVVVAVLLVLLAFATTRLVLPLLYEAYSLDLGEGRGVRAIAEIVCAVVIPAAVLVRLPENAASFVSLGWWLGGAEFALTPTVDLSTYGISDTNRQNVIVLWILLFLTAGAAIASVLRPGRSDTGATRPEG
jgi:hypothetical protein